MNNHYKFIEQHGTTFMNAINAANPTYIKNIDELSAAHGDKCYSWKKKWQDHGIPFHYGVMIYLLSYLNPWCNTVRSTPNGWVDTDTWVIDLYWNNEAVKQAVKDCEEAVALNALQQERWLVCH